MHENSPPRLRRGRGAQRRGGGGSCRHTDTGLAFPGWFKPPRRGLWLRLPLLIQGGEPSCRVSRQKLVYDREGRDVIPDSLHVEIQHPKTRYRIIDDEQLRGLVGLNSLGDLQESCRTGVEAALKRKPAVRQSLWTESLAVGSPGVVETFQKQLGGRGKGREILPAEGRCHLRESDATYRALLGGKKGHLSLENTLLWIELSITPYLSLVRPHASSID